MKKSFIRNFRRIKAPIDLNLFLVIVFLNIFGIIMIYSASYYYAEYTYHQSPIYFAKKQTEYVMLGMLGMLIVSFIRPSFFAKFPWLLFLSGAFALILAVRIPGLGHASHGAYRWIKIGGATIQVAEPVKIFCIFFLAGFLNKYGITDHRMALFVFIAVSIISALLLFVSDNMSTACIVFLIMFFTLMINDRKQKFYILLMIGGLLLAGLLILYIDRGLPYSETENFRITRIRAWLYPTDDQFIDDQAYQATQALYAIGSGGFFGKGLGQSLIKFRLPEPHNDYILSIVIEELGVFGFILLSFLYIYLLYKIFMIYIETESRYSRVLVLGVFLHLAIQVLMNYMVTLGLFPTMGVTLPFISAGGSSATFTLVELGIVLAVSRRNTERRILKEAVQEQEMEDPRYRELREIRRDRKRLHERNVRKRQAREKSANRG